MTAFALSRQQAREIDERTVSEYGLPSIVLMENAGRGLADKLFQFGLTGPVVICCGAGNNGGDGFVLARHLDYRRGTVRVLLWGEPGKLRGDAAVNYRVLEKSGVPIDVCDADSGPRQLDDALRTAGVIVDALLGTGARGEPRPPLDAVIERLNRSGVPIVAVDLPSGLDCDTGAAATHTIRALHTCTFVAPKAGFTAPEAARYTGVVHVLDIGAPWRLVDEVLRRGPRPPA